MEAVSLAKNPTHPDDSPIRTEHAGSWDPTVYRNYVQSPAKPQGGLKAHVYGRPGVRSNELTGQSTTEVFASAYDYEYSKTDDAKVDKALEQAIQKDLTDRNIKGKRNKTN